MLETLLNLLENYAENHYGHTWLENHLLYLTILGVAITVVMGVIFFIKINKDIKRMDRDQRKRDKRNLKYLSNKKNKTY